MLYWQTMMYNCWQYEVNQHNTLPGSERSRLKLCLCADCSMFRKYKDYKDQRAAAVHFIVLKWRFLPPRCETRGPEREELLTNLCLFMCAYTHTHTHPPAVEQHFTLPSSCLFCSLNLLPSQSGKRLLWNPSHINYFLFPTCPVTNLGSWRWITLHSKSALNTEFEILFTPLLVNSSPYGPSRNFHPAPSSQQWHRLN